MRRLTAIVVTYNSSLLFPEFAASLPAACAGTEWSVVVADNDSSDGTAAVVRARLPAARVVETGRNAGYAAGINAALAAAPPSDAYLILNPDVRLRPGAASALLAALDQPGVGIAVPRIVDGDGRPAWSLRRDPTVGRALGESLLGGVRAGRFAALGEMVTDPAAYRRPGPVDWASGAVMLVSAACAEAVGAWDERFFLYSEETDFALRARTAGFGTWFEPTAEVVHLEGESHQSPWLWALLTRNRLRLFGHRHGPVRTAGFWMALVTGEALRAVRGPQHRAALRALLRRTAPTTPGVAA
jgi:N-acetylglucosaminyl-diphospho-decaprenol L-rhamnosyltransferase